MSKKNLQNRYSVSARWLHWATAVFVILAYIFINVRSAFEHGTALRSFIMEGHFWSGIVVLMLAFPRVFERYHRRPPEIMPPLERRAQILATASHHALYAFLFIQPLLGVLTVWLEDGALPVPFTSASIASPFPVMAATAHALESIHVFLGTAFYYVIGLHVLAVLFHHFIRKDNTLRRML